MKFSNAINSIIVLVVVIFLASLAFHVKTGTTADSIAVLKTAGMTCGSCSSKITTALEALKGVAVAEVDINGGWVVVGYDTKAVKPEALAEKVNGAGFVSTVHRVLTPEQFKTTTGRDIGTGAVPSGGCGGCGTNGGCGTKNQS
ncbi:MAG: heavy-metal-associated domain-containing protein [Geobacteraceae bacterium]|nr:heavy-metal-associated domain-containing protein [Geobacteraceae bacterium]